VHVINVRHGWELPEDIHDEHLRQINEACMDILQRMPRFDWGLYGRELVKKGLRLKTIKNKAGEVVAYNIFMGHSKFKSSSLGTGRNLTVKNIENTWSKLHSFHFPSIESRNAAQQSSSPAAIVAHAAEPEPMRVTFHTEYDVDGKKIPVSIPMEAYDAIRDKCRMDYEGSSLAGTVEDVIKTGVLLFIGSIDAATTLSTSYGGGGSQPDSGWGRDPKEDEREWARRCARMALQMAKPVQRTRSFRRNPKAIISCDNPHYENIPSTWVCTTIGSIFQHNTGKALNKSTSEEGTLLPYLTTSNVYWNSFDLSVIKEMRFKDSEMDKCTVQKGDLLVCEGGDIGRSAIWNKDYSICIQNHLHRLRPKGDVIPLLYMYYIMHLKRTNNIEGKGIGLQGFSSGMLDKLEIPLPPYNEQNRIVNKIKETFYILDSIGGSLC